MRILITGINGFVGSNFCRKWNEKYILYGLSQNLKKKNGVKQIYSWDKLKEVPRVNTIIHLAGKAHDTKNITDAEIYFEVNTQLTKILFDYFMKSESNNFIFFSSVKAVANIVRGDFLTEDVLPMPIGAFGESKINAENYILSKLNECKQLNKKVYIVRPCMIHGQGNKGNLNLLYNIVNKGIPWPLGSYSNQRSFCSIDNVVYLIEQIILRNIESGIYNISDDKPISTNKLIEIISHVENKKTKIINLPKGLLDVLSRIGDLLKLPLNTERLGKLTENYVVCNHKIKRALKIENLPFSVEEGLIKTIKSFKE